MTDSEKLAAWEKAYLSLYKFGHIGRVFKGTVHNLNGVVQAFSMQTELFELMFAKFRKQLSPLLNEPISPASKEAIETVLKLVDKREKMLAPMTDKVAYSQEIIKNTENICQRTHNDDTLSLSMLLANVINFYHSDMYFKHKVSVSCDIQSNFVVDSSCNDLGLVFQNLIQNAVTSLILSEVEHPAIDFSCNEDESSISVSIRDNGAGVDPALSDTLYEPFTSGWDEHSGLGLYFCKQICSAMGCSLHYNSDAACTDFIVTIPK